MSSEYGDNTRHKLLGELIDFTDQLTKSAQKLDLDNLHKYIEMVRLETALAKADFTREEGLFRDSLTSRGTAARYVGLLNIMERDFSRTGNDLVVYFLQMLVDALEEQYPPLTKAEISKLENLEQKSNNT